jgi:hypothetical protein
MVGFYANLILRINNFNIYTINDSNKDDMFISNNLKDKWLIFIKVKIGNFIQCYSDSKQN